MKPMTLPDKLGRWWGAASLALLLALGWPARLCAATGDESRDRDRRETRERSESHDESSRASRELVNVFNGSELGVGERAIVAVTVFGDAKISGEVESQCVTVFGNATVDGHVGGDCVTVFGNLDLNSKVGGQVVVVGGDARLGPKAEVLGDLVVVGGKLKLEPGAKYSGQKFEMGGIFAGLGEWFRSGLLLGRPIAPGVWWVWVIVALHFLFYLIFVVVAPRSVEACEQAVRNQPVASFGVGLLTMILSGPLMIILGATGIGLLVVPFVVLGLKLAGWLGKAAIFPWIGRGILSRFGGGRPGSLVGGYCIGFVVVTLIYLVPFIGFIVWGLLLPLSLGGGIMAAVEAIRRNRASRPAPVVPVAGGFANGAGLAAGVSLPAGDAGGVGGELVSLPRAGFWIRFAATLLDFVLLSWMVSFLDGVFPFLWVAYHVGMWTWKGTTIGGIVCGLKVVRVDGRSLDFSVALVRGLAAVFSFMALCIGFFWAGWTADRQSWHDKIAGTTIVKVPKSVSLI